MWTSREIAYLEENAHRGADEIAKKLGKTPNAVRIQASRCEISLRRRWFCIKCGRWSFHPLSKKTGWCIACTRERRNNEIKESIEQMRAENAQIEEKNKESHRLYSKKYRQKVK